MKRTLLRNSAATALIAALTFAPTALAEDRGSAEAFWGDIYAFEGQTTPFAGDVNPFWGDIYAFWGDIYAFNGELSPFWGDIYAFWGDIYAFDDGGVHPYWGDIYAFWGDPEAFAGSVAPLWGDIYAFWGDIYAFEDNTTEAYALQSLFEELVTRSEAFWGDAVTAETGLSFKDGFSNAVFQKYGIDINDPSTFAGFTAVQRAQFFFDWYDGLMGFSGRDHVDHWMGTANWTPAMTQEAGGGADTYIGLIDFSLHTDPTLSAKIDMWNGYDNPGLGHGAAVGSLLASDHDGKGVMGIAPNAKLLAYNPFDESNTATWDEVEHGVLQVSKWGAHVVNMSLGLPGATLSEDWNELYSRTAITRILGSTIFVHAAGNEGAEQTHDIEWNHLFDPNMLVVGSVGPTGVISPFSNTPGEACLLAAGVCYEENKLKYRFLVAPGEWILVSDGQGGVRRHSGTSFAAPIVTGAIALQFDRWSWLTDHPQEVINIILSTATDLGEEGVDGVYGHGLLNIGRSLEPLDEDKLYILSATGDKDLLSTVSTTEQLLWAATDGEVTVYEDIGGTFRDFRMPMDAVLSSTTTTLTDSADTLQKQMDTTLTTASTLLSDPLTSTTTKKRKGRQRLIAEGALPNQFGWDASFALAPSSAELVGVDNALPYSGELALTSSSNITLRLGAGMGAQSLAGNNAFANASYNPYTGGANSILGLANGGAFGKVEMPLANDLRLDVGMTSRTFENHHVMPFSGEQRLVNQTVKPYEARAANVSLVKSLGDNLSLNAGYTYLSEAQGLLGVQSANTNTFNAGAQTDAATIGADWSLSERITLSSSATLGRTRSQEDAPQLLRVSETGVTTSSFETAVSFAGVFDDNDAARIALIQPMHVENGGLDINATEVVNRTTGQLGAVTTFTPIDGQARKLALEAVYARALLNDTAEVSAFVRGEANTAAGTGADTTQMLGAAFKLNF